MSEKAWLNTAVCVFCNVAWAKSDGNGGVVWVVTMETPPDCEHETIEGRT